jgi:hypothetical protein
MILRNPSSTTWPKQYLTSRAQDNIHFTHNTQFYAHIVLHTTLSKINPQWQGSKWIYEKVHQPSHKFIKNQNLQHPDYCGCTIYANHEIEYITILWRNVDHSLEDLIFLQPIQDHIVINIQKDDAQLSTTLYAYIAIYVRLISDTRNQELGHQQPHYQYSTQYHKNTLLTQGTKTTNVF